MVTEARNLPLIVGFDAPANAPEVRNLPLVVGYDAVANAPEVRNLALVVGYDDPASIPPAVVPVFEQQTFTAITAQSSWSVASGSPAAGNLLLAFLGSVDTQTTLFGGATGEPTPPAGWTILHTGTNRSAGGDCSGFVFWKVAGGSEPANYSFNMGASTSGAAHIVEVSNPAATPINGSNYVATSAGETQANVPSFTTTVNGCLLVAFCFADEDSGAYAPYYSDPMVPGWTARYGSSSVPNTVAGDTSYSGIASSVQPSAAPTGFTVCRVAAQNDALIAYAVAVAPGPGSGGGSGAPKVTGGRRRRRIVIVGA